VRAQQNLGALETARGNWTQARELLELRWRAPRRRRCSRRPRSAASTWRSSRWPRAASATRSATLDRAGALFAERKDQRGSIDVLLLKRNALLAAGAREQAQQALARGANCSRRDRRAAGGAELLRAALAGSARRRPRAPGAAAAARPRRAPGCRCCACASPSRATKPPPTASTRTRAGSATCRLRLEWLEHAMRRELAGRPRGEATVPPRAGSLRGHEQALLAPSLHALGARALRRAATGLRRRAQASAARGALCCRSCPAALARRLRQPARRARECTMTPPPPRSSNCATATSSCSIARGQPVAVPDARALGLRVQEDERRRIARELHDGIGQNLTAIKHQLAVLQAQLRPAAGEAERLGACIELCAQTARGHAPAVAPAAPAGARRPRPGSALHWLARSVQQPGQVQVAVHVDPVPELDPEVQTLLFRVCQEALANVVKHANASDALLRLGARGGRVQLTVWDNGAGFDVEAAAGSAAAAWPRAVRMRERTRALRRRAARGFRRRFRHLAARERAGAAAGRVA
jgi:signal transduction histidine kinase